MTRRILTPATLLLLVAATTATGRALQTAPDREPVDQRWLDRLEEEDRAPLDAILGYEIPRFTGDLKWIGGERRNWLGLRGKVVVIQSWTSRSSAGRSWPQRVAKTLEECSADDVVILALHTPEGADKAETFLERRPAPMPVVLDPTGAYCDEIGVYKRPVNIVVDRHGEVRYAGLNARGLPQAVAKLVAEAFDPQKMAPRRDLEAAGEKKAFPHFTAPVQSARDMRGRKAPEMYVTQWLNGRPALEDKVVIVDFWATWCGPCVRSIPHVNGLANQFRDDVVVVGISDETPEAFRSGLDRKGLTARRFSYHLALDETGRMKKAVAVRGIPHAIVMSSDWVVRWQGHPATLKPSDLAMIVEADRGAAGPTRRWQK